MQTIGYTYLISRYKLEVVMPYCQSFLTTVTAIEREHSVQGEKQFFPMKYAVEDTWQAHLLFALKHEGIHLAILKSFFEICDVAELTTWIQTKRVSLPHRRIWFFYEFLMQRELPIESMKVGNYGFALPPEDYFSLSKENAPRAQRQRLYNNLPGDYRLCPMVRLTQKIKGAMAINYSQKISEALAHYPSELVYRANAFLYLKETRSSFAIERQTPSQKRAATFMELLKLAGETPLTKASLIQFQNTIVDTRYAENDYRNDQVYVGQTLAPGREYIHFIGVKPNDVPAFMEAYLENLSRLLSTTVHPIILAAVYAFAFVFIHPFNDGNGRLHRYLMHHILATKSVTPSDLLFPVSAVLYKDPKLYDQMLESFSKPLMQRLDYQLNDKGELMVLTESAEHYRFIDFTTIVEIFFDVIQKTIEIELVPELDYLYAWEKAITEMKDVVDLPDKKMNQFILFTQQNKGKLPKARRKLFEELTDEEITALAVIVSKTILQLHKK